MATGAAVPITIGLDNPADGLASSHLVIHSNDPAVPIVRVPLRAFVSADDVELSSFSAAEELWDTLATRDKMLVHADWPSYGEDLIDKDADVGMNWVITLIDEDHHKMEMFFESEQGEMKGMEIEYERR